jgi:tetratricopeptide (TPR) repeat protein
LTIVAHAARRQECRAASEALNARPDLVIVDWRLKRWHENLRTTFGEIDALARAEDYGEALRRIEVLAESHPGEPWVWSKRAFINVQQGENQTAIADLTKAISICGLEPAFFFKRGRFFFDEGKYREAVSDLTKVIELCDYHNSDYYRESAYFRRADAYVRIGEFDKARAIAIMLKLGSKCGRMR